MTETQIVIALLGLGFAVISAVTIYLTNLVKRQRVEWDREHTRLWDRLDQALLRLEQESREAHTALAAQIDQRRLEAKADIAMVRAEVITMMQLAGKGRSA